MATNYKELEQKLTALGHTEKTVEGIVSAMVAMDKVGLNDDEKYAAYSLLSSVGMDILNAVPDWVAKGEWVDFQLGNVAVGDYVRVKKNAYTSDSGVNHNGKVGRLARMHGGKCTINYLGLDTGDGMLHPYGYLESLKRV